MTVLYEEERKKRLEEKNRRGAKRTSQELVLAKVHPLDDVSAVVEYAADILRVHGAGEVWVAVVLAISAGCADAQEFISDEVLCSNDFRVFSRFNNSIRGSLVVRKFLKILF